MRKALVCAVALVATAAANAAPIVNGDFNSGLSGWTTSLSGGSAFTTNSYGAVGDSPSGNPFAVVTAGSTNNYQTLSQTFAANAGQWVSFDWFFQANDYLPYNDDAYLTITGPSGTTTIFSSNVAAVGNYGNTGWQSGNYFISANGNYTISVGVANRLDSILSSGVGLDGVMTPEPVSMVVFGGLLVGGGWLARRRMKAAA